MDFAFLDGLTEYAYVAVPASLELIYLNKPLRERLDLQANCPGKCYEILQLRHSPCEHCAAAKARDTDYSDWPHRIAALAGDFIIRDTLIDKDGHKLRLALCFERSELLEHAALPLTRYAGQLISCSVDDFDATITRLLKDLCQRFEAEYCFICENLSGSELMVTQRSDKEKPYSVLDSLRVNSALLRELEQSSRGDEPLFICSTANIKENLPRLHRLLIQTSVQNALILPLRRGNSLLGLMCLINLRNTELAGYSLPALKSVASFTAAAMFSNTHDSRNTRISRGQDGLYSRNKLTTDLRLLSQTPLGCIVADINGLKGINEERGMEAGDNAISDCMCLLREYLPDDRIYRVGDDEFAVILLNLSRREFENRLFSVRQALSGPHGFSASVGGCYEPGGDANAAFASAEKYMTRDKSRFYLQMKSFEFAGGKRSQEYLRILSRPSAVQDLLDSGSFYSVIQPIYAANGRNLIAAEVLCRLRLHGKEVSPTDFIPLLETANLIYKIDLFNFAESCKKLSRWQQEGRSCCPLCINLSRHSVLQHNFCAKLCDLADQYGIRRSLFHLELTETVAERDRAELIEAARDLSQAGFLLSVDDFGVDYANLITIADLPLKILKYDKRIVDTLQDNPKMQLIFKSFQKLCEELNVETIAEGVERDDQVKLLNSLGCHNMQGFYFSRPLPPAQFEQLLTIRD